MGVCFVIRQNSGWVGALGGFSCLECSFCGLLDLLFTFVLVRLGLEFAIWFVLGLMPLLVCA